MKKPFVGLLNTTNARVPVVYREVPVLLNPGQRTKKEFNPKYLVVPKGVKQF